MGGQLSSLLFSSTCEGVCLHDDTLSLKERMARYGVNSSMTRSPGDVVALRVQLYVSEAQQPTTHFLPGADKVSNRRARIPHWLAQQLHERFHPDVLLVLPHEFNLLFLRGQCPYGAKTDVLCSVVSSFVTSCLGRQRLEECMYEARTRVFCFSQSIPANCQCAHWEAHNYLVHRSQQGNEWTKRCMGSADLNTLHDTVRWGYLLCHTRFVPLFADWWKTALRPLHLAEALPPTHTGALLPAEGKKAKPNFKGLARPEDVTPAFLQSIVAMTRPGATVDLSDFPSLQTCHVERLCLDWMACERMPRKLLLTGTLVDGGLILSRPILQFLSHPQVACVDVRGTSFLECADPALLQRLILEGDLDRLQFCDDSLPAWRALSREAQLRILGMSNSLK